VPLTILAVVVPTPAGVSVEAAAREARYAALAANLEAGECLLTAHHRDDQAQTLLLQALRGTGLRGLSAMPPCRPFGRGWHLRPVLEVAQHELLACHASAATGAPPAGTSPTATNSATATTATTTATPNANAEAGVARGPPGTAIDPMNEDLRFDRVYLRRRVWPLLEARWPGAGSALSRTARHVAEAEELLERGAEAHLGRLRDGEALSLPRLRALGQAERINAVRHWIRQSGAEPPPTARLHEALRQLFDADADHLPAVVWGDYALRRYRDRVFLTAAQPPRLQGTRRWEVALGASVELGPGLGTLRWAAAARRGGGIAPHRLPPTLSVRARRGGETLRPAAHAKTQSVQHLCQSLGVLPWLREALPYVFAEDVLIAVGDLWHDASACGALHRERTSSDRATVGHAPRTHALGDHTSSDRTPADAEWLIVWERAPIIV